MFNSSIKLGVFNLTVRLRHWDVVESLDQVSNSIVVTAGVDFINPFTFVLCPKLLHH